MALARWMRSCQTRRFPWRPSWELAHVGAVFGSNFRCGAGPIMGERHPKRKETVKYIPSARPIETGNIWIIWLHLVISGSYLVISGSYLVTFQLMSAKSHGCWPCHQRWAASPEALPFVQEAPQPRSPKLNH